MRSRSRPGVASRRCEGLSHGTESKSAFIGIGVWLIPGKDESLTKCKGATMNARTDVLSLRNFAPLPFSSVESADGVGAWALSGRLTAPRGNGHTATRLTNGKVLLAGGLGANETSISSADLYRPIQGLCTATGGMIARRASHSATRLLSGRVLVAGGFDQQSGSVSVHATAEIYKPSPGTWASTDEAEHAARVSLRHAASRWKGACRRRF